MRDQTQNLKATLALAPAVVTDNTAQVSAVCNRAGFDCVTLLILLGTLSDADATSTLLVEESDASGSGYTAVADADLIGTEAGAAPIFSDDSKVAKIGYKGTKQYVRATLTPVNNTGNIPIAMVWLMHGARTLPQSTQIV